MFVAYTGHLTQKNTGRWHTLMPGQWASVRHQIESFGLEMLEQEALTSKLKTSYNGRPHGNTIVRAYQMFMPLRKYKNNYSEWPEGLQAMLNIQKNPVEFGPEVLGRTFLLPNTFLLLVRESMPLGGRPFVPIQETSKYALANHNLSIRPQNEDLQKKVNDLLKETEDKFHASERPLKKVKIEFFQSSTEYTYLEPPMDYLCTECNKFGHHFKEACWLWPQKTTMATGTAFGAKKFKEAKMVNETDQVYYSLLHKRQNRPK